MQTQSQEACDRQSGRDGELANGHRNQGRDQASESHQQKCERRRNHETFGVSARRRRWLSECRNSAESRPSVRASRPDNGPATDLEDDSPAREAWERATPRALGRRESHQNKRPAAFAQENRIAQIQDRKRLRTRRVRLSAPPQWLLMLARPQSESAGGSP